MNVVLLRVGIDTGAGGIHSPLFPDGTFEFVPIPDGQRLDERTYGDARGRHGRPLVEYFPPARRAAMARHPMHVDPEWETYTYGDPTRLKSGLRRLGPGDLLVFYAGLQGWGFVCAPALYVVGSFEVEAAGRATGFPDAELRDRFVRNFHVRHHAVFAEQRERLVLVGGGPGSHLLERARRISEAGRTLTGKPLHVLSAEAREVFGDFEGRVSIQRSPPRWVAPEHAERAATWVRALR